MSELNISELTAHITDDDIEHGIDGKNLDDVEKVREALAAFQKSASESWGVHMDGIKNGHYWLVKETDDMIILAAEDVPHENYLSPTGHDSEEMQHAVSGVMHTLAKRHSDYGWGYSYPLVIAKPDDFNSGRRFVETVIKGYLNKGLSPGQAWAYYGVEILGYSRNSWSKRCGYSDHSAVSEPLRKAKQKLPSCA